VDTSLIETIVKEVVKQVTTMSCKPEILVLAKKTEFLEKKVKKILPMKTGMVWMDGIEPFTLPSSIERFEQIILPELSIKVMADLALGRPLGRIANMILTLLLDGYPVKVMEFEYHAYKNTAPAGLWELYTSYEKTLKGFGLSGYSQNPIKKFRVRKHLICEKDMDKIRTSNIRKIILSPHAMVTALARDLARKYKIEILRENKGA
jgi:ethanolamine utilization protein